MRRVRYRPAARADIRSILATSQRDFGVKAQRAYRATIQRAVRLICENPTRAGVSRDAALTAGAALFHLRHARERGRSPRAPRHMLVFVFDETSITLLRVLHDAMDIAAHVSGDGD
jgi:toxin ParE1/3/4